MGGERHSFRAVGASVALLAAFAAATAPASASVRYDGKTSQRQSVTVKTSNQGIAYDVVIRFRPSCRSGFRGKQRFIGPFGVATRNLFRDGGRYTLRYGNGATRGKIRTKVKGIRAGPTRLRGWFRFRGRYFERDGTWYGTCRARVMWHADSR